MPDVIPKGTPAAVSLVLVADGAGGSDEFQPMAGVARTASGSGYGVPVQVFVQEAASSATSQTRHRLNANQLANQTRDILTTPSTINALQVMAIQYPYDPATAGPNKDIRRGTGGELSVANPIYAEGAVTNDTGERAGQDVRAFLYAQDDVTATQAIRLNASPGGALNVATAVPATITTASDFTTIAATNSSIIAANTSRRVAIVQNLDATNNVRVGDTNITNTRGIRIGPGESVTLETTAEIFVRPEAGTPAVSRTEIEG